MLIDMWRKRMCYIYIGEFCLYIYMGILFSCIKSEIMFCMVVWVELEDVIVSEISWERRRCIVNLFKKFILECVMVFRM